MSEEIYLTREEEEEEKEEEDRALVSSALRLSRRLSDTGTDFEPLPYDLYDDADYSCGDTTGASIPEEFQQLASFFTQMMQTGQEQSDGDVSSTEGKDNSHSQSDEEDEGDDEEDDTEEDVLAKGAGGGEVAGLPNDMHRAVFRCKKVYVC